MKGKFKMMINRLIIFANLFALFFIVSGCSKKPSDFPQVYSCTITVVNNGKPIEGATVTFNYESTGAVTVTAITDAQGIAKMQSLQLSYATNGAPAGKAKILLQKYPVIADTRTPEEKKGKTVEEREAFKQSLIDKINATPREIPDLFANLETTPLTIEIENKTTNLTIDIAKYANNK
ncbi:MAG: Ig-like domain-containing protein [Planctomycetaceae bacterium]|jgi:hypothetical protein|nr:Ig-like domain-containing protein [Planctomycetaceae bacterium]